MVTWFSKGKWSGRGNCIWTDMCPERQHDFSRIPEGSSPDKSLRKKGRGGKRVEKTKKRQEEKN